jgi:hypothetical protein
VSNAQIRFTVERQGSTVLLSGNGDVITMTADGPVKPDISRVDFAVWTLLPIAMSKGCDLHIAGTGDPVTVRNAREYSRIWELWMPEKFRAISVSFDEYAPGASGSGRLVLYSGGVDSTYNLLNYEKRGERPTLLTLQGFDYKYDDDKRFRRLIEHTRPFVERVSAGHILLKTNLLRVYHAHGVTSRISHGSALAGSLLLFAHAFEAGEIAPDFTLAQEYVAYPWGTNSVTNPLLASSYFRMDTANNQLSRAAKLQELVNSEIALSSLSFCKDYDTRPLNCGVCTKCTRTKAMFLATCGRIPPIFVDPTLRPLNEVLHLDKRHDRAFFLDLYQAARANGTLGHLPGVDAMANAVFSRPEDQRAKNRRLDRKLLAWIFSRVAMAVGTR